VTLFVSFDPGVVPRFLAPDDAGALPSCCTAVLQDESGRVGFERDKDGEVLRALLGSAAVIEASNQPRWALLEEKSVSTRRLAMLGRVVVAGSFPGPQLLEQLNLVTSNQARKKKNEIFLRNGRPATPVLPTLLDNWIAGDGRVSLSAMRWLAAQCKQLSMWSSMNGGYTGRFLSWSQDDLLALVQNVEVAAGVRAVQVAHEADLPAW
jgi:hypothetical protein